MTNETYEQRRERFMMYPSKQERYWSVLRPLDYGYRNMPHYMAQKKWRDIRERLIRERGFKCELCLETPVPAVGIAVHHITYERACEEMDTDLVLLCRNCHSICHFASHKMRIPQQTFELLMELTVKAGYKKIDAMSFLDDALKTVEMNLELFTRKR